MDASDLIDSLAIYSALRKNRISGITCVSCPLNKKADKLLQNHQSVEWEYGITAYKL